MITIQQMRERYPVFADRSDEELRGIAERFGITLTTARPPSEGRAGILGNIGLGAQQAMRGLGRNLADAGQEIAAQAGWEDIRGALAREVANRDAEMAERQARMMEGSGELSRITERPGAVVSGAVGSMLGSIPFAMTPAGWGMILGSNIGGNLREQGDAQGLAVGDRSLMTAVPAAVAQTALERALGVEGFVARGMRGVGATAGGRLTHGAIAGSVGEGLQEGLSEAITIAQGDIRNPGRLFEMDNLGRVGEAAGLGAIGGGVMQGAISAVRAPRAEPQPESEDLREALDTLRGIDPPPVTPTAPVTPPIPGGAAVLPDPIPAPPAPDVASVQPEPNATIRALAAPPAPPPLPPPPPPPVSPAPAPQTVVPPTAAANRLVEDEQDYQLAVQAVQSSGNTTIRNVQKTLGWGLERSRRAIQRMEAEGILSRPGVDGRRTLLRAAPAQAEAPQPAAAPAQARAGAPQPAAPAQARAEAPQPAPAAAEPEAIQAAPVEQQAAETPPPVERGAPNREAQQEAAPGPSREAIPFMDARSAPQQEPEALSAAIEAMQPGGARALPASEAGAAPAMPPQVDRLAARVGRREPQAAPPVQDRPTQDRIEAAERVVNETLRKYEGRGSQGQQIANDIRAQVLPALREGRIDADQASAAFEVGDTISDILPSKARQAAQFFFEGLGGRQGEQEALSKRRADGIDGIMRMSVAPDLVTFARETAAHEAWHVIEDWLRFSDPQQYRALQRAFPRERDGTVQMNRIDGGILRVLKRYAHPSGGTYHDYIARTTDAGPGVFSNPSEARAIIFGGLYEIRRSGVTPQIGAMQRVFDFFADLMDRLRGRTAARSLNEAVTGGYRQRMGETERPTIRPAQETPDPDAEPGVAPVIRTSARELPPAVREAAERLSGRGPGQTLARALGKRVWSSGIRGAASRFRAQTADMYSVLEDMERKLTGDNRLMASMSGYVAMWRASDTERYLADMVTNGGYPELVRGSERGASYVKINREGKGGMEWLTKLLAGIDQKTGNKLTKPDGSDLIETQEEANAVMQAFRVYALAKRGTQLNANGIIVPIGPPERAAAAQAARAFPEIVPAFEAYQDYNRRLMKLAVDSGVLQAEDAEAYMRYNDYYPFYRAAPELDPLNVRRIAGVSTKFKPREITGGPEPFADDPLAVILENSSYWLNASLKNIAMQKVIDTGLRIGVIRPFDKKNDQPEERLNVRVRGIDYAFATDDPDILSAINAYWTIDPKLQTVARVAGWPGRMLREMITKEPGFMLYANPMRDSVSTWVTSGANFTPIASTYANLLKAVADDPLAMQYRALGSAGSMRHEDVALRDPAEIVRGDILVQKGIYRASGPGQLLDVLRHAWLKWDKVSEASDMAARLSVFEQTLRETGDEAEAAWRAREMMNFTKRGQSELLKIIATLVPFTNSRIQGLDVLFQALSGNRVGDNRKSREQRQGQVMARMAILASAAVMIAMLTGDDEEVREAPEFLRNKNVLIPLRMIGLGDSGLLAIPKPFEIGLLSMTLPEQMYRLMNGEQTGFAAASAILSLSGETLILPVVPPAIVAVAEQMANYSFFTGNQIVGRALAAQPPELQFTAQTPPIYREIASAFAESGIPSFLRNYGLALPGFMTSPERMDHFVRAFAGTVGVQLAVGAGVLAGAESVRPPDWTNLPIVSRAFIREGSRQPAGIATLYSLIDEANRLTRQLEYYQRTGHAEMVEMIARDSGALIRARPALQQMERRMSRLSQRERELLRSVNVPMEQRRPELERISEEKRATVRAIEAIRLNVGR